MRSPVLELFPMMRPGAWVRVARDLRANAGDAAAVRFCREAARLREEAGNLDEARGVYLHMLRVLVPGHLPTIRRLSDVERKLHARKLRAEAPRARRRGDHDRALRIYLQLLALEPEDGFHPLRAGDCLVRAGRRDEAIECYREARARFLAGGHENRARAVERILRRLDAPAAVAAPRSRVAV